MDERYYTSQIEQTFDKLENSRRRAIKSSPAPSDGWRIAVFGASALGFVASAVSVSLLSDLNTVGTWSSTMGLCFSSLGLVTSSHKDWHEKSIQIAMILCGRSRPLTSRQADNLSVWSRQHPRLVSILGKWAANNKDGMLNERDHDNVRRAVKKVENIGDKIIELAEINKSLLDAGIASSTKRHKLANIANQKDVEGATPSKKPAI